MRSGWFRAGFPALVLFLAALAAALVRAQGPPKPVTWSLSLPAGTPAAVSPGGRLTLAIGATITEGWHIYGTEELKAGPRPLSITLPAGQPFTAAGRLQAPEAEREFDAAFEQVVTFYDRPTTFRLPVAVAAGARRGQASVAVEVSFQACDGRICLPVRTVKLSVPVEIR